MRTVDTLTRLMPKASALPSFTCSSEMRQPVAAPVPVDEYWMALPLTVTVALLTLYPLTEQESMRATCPVAKPQPAKEHVNVAVEPVPLVLVGFTMPWLM